MNLILYALYFLLAIVAVVVLFFLFKAAGVALLIASIWFMFVLDRFKIRGRLR